MARVLGFAAHTYAAAPGALLYTFAGTTALVALNIDPQVLLHVPSAVPTETIVRNATNHAAVARGRTATRKVKRGRREKESVDRQRKGNLFFGRSVKTRRDRFRIERVGCSVREGPGGRGFATRAASGCACRGRAWRGRVRRRGRARRFGSSVHPRTASRASTATPHVGRRDGTGTRARDPGAGRRVRPRARPRRWRRAERSVPARGRRRASRRDAGVDAARRADAARGLPRLRTPAGSGDVSSDALEPFSLNGLTRIARLRSTSDEIPGSTLGETICTENIRRGDTPAAETLVRRRSRRGTPKRGLRPAASLPSPSPPLRFLSRHRPHDRVPVIPPPMRYPPHARSMRSTTPASPRPGRRSGFSATELPFATSSVARPPHAHAAVRAQRRERASVRRKRAPSHARRPFEPARDGSIAFFLERVQRAARRRVAPVTHPVDPHANSTSVSSEESRIVGGIRIVSL